jgi:hypothetical protein
MAPDFLGWLYFIHHDSHTPKLSAMPDYCMRATQKRQSFCSICLDTLNIAEHRGTSRNIAEHRGTSRNIAEHRGTSRNIAEHRGTSRPTDAISKSKTDGHPASDVHLFFHTCEN